MRFVKQLLVFLSFVACQQSTEAPEQNVPTFTIHADSLELRPNEGLVYYQNQPFSGTSITYYPSGTKASSIAYVKGKKHGKYRKWFEEGIKSFEANYVNAKRNGAAFTWWRNGNMRSSSNYKEGVVHGIQEEWYVHGTKFKRLQLLDGKEEGLQQSWRENGKLYSNYEAKNGRIFGLKRAKLCYDLDNEIVQYSNQ